MKLCPKKKMVVPVNQHLKINTTVTIWYEAHIILGCINKSIVCRSKEVIAVIRPQLVFVLGATLYKEH